ncbi:MAG: tRNA (N6-isopentenyl adenosine(37)-C2)-methylthiotransferase MiaB [Syntrophomonadaceae bacterium]|nr:tRNA (N6-isopentenyl adenosine(37)-C2)-methylthiotransferase MiaB [Syntrophomonadaceae bacterium]
MNERDSEIISGLLEESGYHEASSLEEADLVVLNTCSVRHTAENKVFGKLGQIKVIKSKNPHLKVALGGCMAQLPEVRGRLKRLGVDLVFGTHNIHELPSLLEKMGGKGAPFVSVWDKPGEVVENLPDKRTAGVTSFVNIMYGCNNYCSYCIVPYVRGNERSRDSKDILAEIRKLVEEGVREVTLLGQNVNSYGRGLAEKIDFADLLTMVNGIDGLERIRFMTSHPLDITPKLIDAVGSLTRVCEHVHAPVQAGSNKILKLMNRGYTVEQYIELTEAMRAGIPGVAITSDLIVGFPGEEEDDFAQTMEVVKKVEFDAAFTFIYSQRSGTKAFTMENQLPRTVKTERLIRLNEVQYNLALEKNRQLESKVVEVLAEGPSKTNAAKMTGRTRCNRLVMFEAPRSTAGKLIHVHIDEAKTFNLLGSVVEGNSLQ